MRYWIDSLKLCAVTIVICVVIYPAAILLAAAIVAPEKRLGSLIERDGKVVGSWLIAQKFERPEYFWPRPSAVDYNASAAGGSNLSPLNPEIRERAEGILTRLGNGQTPAPPELLTASGSGLDPHLTVAAARFQAARVAAARNTSAEQINQLIDRYASLPGGVGQPSLVNVLELNLELDTTFPRTAGPQ